MKLKNINWATMIISLLGVVNGAFLQLGIYHFNSAQLYTIDQAVTILVTACGVMYHNRKGIAAAVPTPTLPPVNTGTASGAK